MKKITLVLVFLLSISCYSQSFGDTKNQVKIKIGPNHQDFGTYIMVKSSEARESLVYMFENNRLRIKGSSKHFNSYEECLNEQGKYIMKYRPQGYELSKRAARKGEVGEVLLAKKDPIRIEVSISKEDNYYVLHWLTTSTAF